MTKEFTTAKRRNAAIEFTLDGVTYSFTPPKQAALILDVLDGADSEVEQARALYDWLGDGLGEEQANALVARLRDPDDDLDWVQLFEIAQWLQEEATGRPTG